MCLYYLDIVCTIKSSPSHNCTKQRLLQTLNLWTPVLAFLWLYYTLTVSHNIQNVSSALVLLRLNSPSFINEINLLNLHNMESEYCDIPNLVVEEKHMWNNRAKECVFQKTIEDVSCGIQLPRYSIYDVRKLWKLLSYMSSRYGWVFT